MFTRDEMQVIHEALTRYGGPWAGSDRLTDKEIEYQNQRLSIRDSLIERFESILMDWWVLEESIKEAE